MGEEKQVIYLPIVFIHFLLLYVAYNKLFLYLFVIEVASSPRAFEAWRNEGNYILDPNYDSVLLKY